ncbi:DUF2513 domain-containing protein [Streptococcus oralis]|uniref:DUF2513 domain-containing protein n=1 Tax=Streptococcus oralis TaxID=1303 RepID=UPI0020C89F8F|nr:DUF2513 domain-containing protein [Streptococcus oralis]MCP9037466.1 DUF2513 domain-containing protein [Streptococcus oralis]MCP9052921.1 DUF2513 domain-containing protein [Streptococcus oralis]MCP9057952.1 DUF2513 domain-containing protein [Streptococcus oralis]MCP9065185.1 DUF2513 domain-containing protein [Streptococcus oralis]MCP9069746.1 DUF2513 domain-containing protein [Streptococcus oralis]
MKLNPDCIRDILFVVEEYSTYSNDVSEDKLYEKLIPKYSQEEILYHVRQCEHSGLFLKVQHYFGGFSIQDLSPYGHQFINDIRQDTNWNRTKDIAKNVGSFSLDVLKDISSQVITNLISNQLGNKF